MTFIAEICARLSQPALPVPSDRPSRWFPSFRPEPREDEPTQPRISLPVRLSADEVRARQVLEAKLAVRLVALTGQRAHLDRALALVEDLGSQTRT